MLTVKNAHKTLTRDDSVNSVDSMFKSNSTTNWISSVRAYHNSDLLASGSDDGFVRIWAYSNGANTLTERFKIAIVNKMLYTFFVLFWHRSI